MVIALWGCATQPPPKLPPPLPKEEVGKCEFYQEGLASWYGNELLGNRTANGEMFVPDGITAAHRKLPFNTLVRVYLENGKGNPYGVLARINDRGPFVHGRIIDLSWGTAKKLGMMDTQRVRVYVCEQ
ncbi:MAG: hypothetical protein DI551_07030 [Micavibrio aeruginosavorus]|uniref:RlpA-like protein double-psi beta-barrel domain-containing protein n=1 Tax=Micavibrio aeruginosavorus TaxID=349221 RepID=A0A2W5MXP4_9BACT|nr:MAG: hypothetical protein DI551_07030 [Micavibrio aeruginosavorus]